MSSERWERTKEILEQALWLAPRRRQVYLDSACGADAELRAEVESLIASHEEAGSQFLGGAAPEVLQLATPSATTDARVVWRWARTGWWKRLAGVAWGWCTRPRTHGFTAS
jgi:hypothetical protein